MNVKLQTSNSQGFTVAEVVVAIGILGFAILTLLSLSSTVLRYQRQSINQMNAVRVNDMVLERALAGILHDAPAGEATTFFTTPYPYPTTPYQTGTETVGKTDFEFRIYATDVPGLGDPTATPPNVLRKLDCYVWWTEEGAGTKKTFSTRIINSGEEP